MKKLPRAALLSAVTLLIAVTGMAVAIVAHTADQAPQGAVTTVKPALAVTVTQLRAESMPLRLAANGSIAAWQEASVGAEANGLRLLEVRVNVGDSVRRGDVLAIFAADTVGAELAQSRAALTEAQATLAEAAANAQRARDLQPSGVLSRQQVQQVLTSERTAQARVDAAQASLRVQELRLTQTRVLAPDDGVISARSATVGAVLPAGQELFRLIRGGRLEWRAEMAAPELARLKASQTVVLTPVGGDAIQGKVRMVAPTVDALTRNGLVYVDLPAGTTARPGMFARGEIAVGAAVPALTLPRTAVLQREGFHYVMRVGADGRVMQTKVTVGRSTAERLEILSGVDANAKLVTSGGGFLGDGDLVRVVAP
ncbi:efflux RND transporter periplasmic adaptor subunit [Roseateles flavus]|uniref:Efflux RND transporter periplasmic adaptor subunit n=1 Tax=Roseateles flavus TaxID=3149041 RepID=A0ABV0G8D5_9BURK